MKATPRWQALPWRHVTAVRARVTIFEVYVLLDPWMVMVEEHRYEPRRCRRSWQVTTPEGDRIYTRWPRAWAAALKRQGSRR